MHLLLPPSEAKTPGGRGRPLGELRPASDPLTSTRAAIAAAVVALARDADAAARALHLPAGAVEHTVAVHRDLLSSPTTPALRRYAGVVYDGLGFAALDPAEQRVAGRSAWVFSGLLGVVRGNEPVPDYRVPAKADLPGLGIAGTRWRPVLDEVMPARLRRGLVVDLRSTDYAAMWRPDPATAERTVTVRVLSPRPRGGLGVISFASKLGKGRLARALVRRVAAGQPVATVDDVVAAWLDAGGVDARVPGARGSAPDATQVELVAATSTA